ncbi:hypothetical protein L1049_012758 [Liquidambar formosana]|uniref:Protein kinase domain-containing protein n=1 Tax=Liquidambar formosana TaxID=63359 RepID=A0AAP0WWX7_LIQFO
MSLIGHCKENSELILVYDYMVNGIMRDYLYKKNLPRLPWKLRLDIYIGVARGLHYLHTRVSRGIIHKDVKTSNIFLSDSFIAKQLTEKSDVNPFGVVLLEVYCIKPAMNTKLPEEQVILAEWAMDLKKNGKLHQAIDPLLTNIVNTELVKKFSNATEECLEERGVDRLSMGKVLWMLESALQLHKASLKGKTEEKNGSSFTSFASPTILAILAVPTPLPLNRHFLYQKRFKGPSKVQVVIDKHLETIMKGI